MLIWLLIFVQFCALIWYVASYVPFARKAMVGCAKRICGGD